MKNFFQRLLTGTMYVACVTVGILVNTYTFLALFSVVTALCLWEFYKLINATRDVNVNPYLNALGGLLLFVSTYLYVSGVSGHFVLLPYLLYIVYLLVTELYRKEENPLSRLGYAFFGQVYIALPVALLNMISFQVDDAGNGHYYPVLALALFVFIWINDTGAYLVGMVFGKNRLFERVSPKKSWEGFFGGLVFTVLSSLVFAHFEPEIDYYHWIAIAVVIVVFGTWGDLIESLIKRNLEVKDSGTSLPGHGGFLDRFDSLLLAVYGMLFYVQLFIRN